jgi:hypothetical protein
MFFHGFLHFFWKNIKIVHQVMPEVSICILYNSLLTAITTQSTLPTELLNKLLLNKYGKSPTYTMSSLKKYQSKVKMY